MPVLIPRPSAAVHAVTLAALCILCALPAQAAGFRQGAYSDTLGSAGLVCVTPQHMAALTASAWKQSMQQRGMDCTVTESSRPLPGLETWKASCTNRAEGTGSGVEHRYQFSRNADGEKLVIDSGMQDATGRQVMKKAFFGDYQGDCKPGTPPLDVEVYLSGERTPGTPAQAQARKAVATDLIRCANVFNGLALSVAKARQEGMRAAAAAVMEAAVELHPGDTDFHVQALQKSAPEVAAELVGASAETKFALYQSCSPYLLPDGIEKAVQGRAAAAAPSAR